MVKGGIMNYSEIVRLNGDKISIDTLNVIEESVECLGDSGRYYGYEWYNICLIPTTEMSGNINIDVYLKKGEY